MKMKKPFFSLKMEMIFYSIALRCEKERKFILKKHFSILLSNVRKKREERRKVMGGWGKIYIVMNRKYE